MKVKFIEFIGREGECGAKKKGVGEHPEGFRDVGLYNKTMETKTNPAREKIGSESKNLRNKGGKKEPSTGRAFDKRGHILVH